MINRFNIVKPKKFTAKDGTEKTVWQQIGTMTEFHKSDGSINRLIEIPAIGLEANAFPFMDGSKQNKKAGEKDITKRVVEQEEVEYPEDDLNPDSIPF